MAKTLADLWEEADKLDKEGKKVANATATAAKLPFTLKDEFRKRQDPALDQAINASEQRVLGGAIEGLNKYQGISNPFTRRDLAEKYQGVLSLGYNNLTDERTRRQGVYSDYIEKWTGLFGAEAARQRDVFQAKLATFERYSNLADKEEDLRRYNIAQAEKGRGSGTAGTSKYQSRLEELSSAVNRGQYTREEANSILEKEVSKGLYKGITSHDSQAIYDLNPDNYEDRPGGWRFDAANTKPKTASEQNQEMDNTAREYYTYLVNSGFDDEAKEYAKKFPQVLK